MSFFSASELEGLRFKHLGDNVLISRRASLYNPESMAVGNNVRVDDFALLSASADVPFVIENNVHISSGARLYGTAGLHIKSFTNISPGAQIFTVTDDFSGNFLIGPTIPVGYRNVTAHPLTLEKHTAIGTCSVVMPGVTLGEGVAIGANSFVKHDCAAWSVYAGSPARWIKERAKKILELEELYLARGLETETGEA